MREKNLDELLISLAVAALISMVLTEKLDEVWQSFVGIWMLMTMVVWNVIDMAQKKRP